MSAEKTTFDGYGRYRAPSVSTPAILPGPVHPEYHEEDKKET